MKVSEIFEKEPVQWGLRGDPFLWRELKEKMKGITMPSSVEALQALIEIEYEKSTGQSIHVMEIIGIERFKSRGMSSGCVSPEFWATKAIPLLLSRYVQPMM